MAVLRQRFRCNSPLSLTNKWFPLLLLFCDTTLQGWQGPRVLLAYIRKFAVVEWLLMSNLGGFWGPLLSKHQQWPPRPHQALLKATLPLCPMVEQFPWSWIEWGWNVSSARAMECSGAENLAAIGAALFPPSLSGNSPLSLTTDHCPQPLLLLPCYGFTPKIGGSLVSLHTSRVTRGELATDRDLSSFWGPAWLCTDTGQCCPTWTLLWNWSPLHSLAKSFSRLWLLQIQCCTIAQLRLEHVARCL